MELLTYLGLFLPLCGFLTLLVSSQYIGRNLCNFIACATIGLAFCCFVSIVCLYGMQAYETTLFAWIPVEGINANFSLHIDHLSLLMTLIITGVGFLIHIYSTGYMEHEEDYARFFACMNFFVFCMLLLVLASHLLLLFMGWEGVGLASYLLIGYYHHRPAAAQAATKAFVINRIGDWGLLVGLLLTFQTFGTSHMGEINQRAGQLFATAAPLISLISFLYFIGASGKSAQLPLHTWLADAMEGPTPVSALIHAATMVTAGVYLIVRMHALFLNAPEVLYYIGCMGAATALFASLCALAQPDLKRVLAYSTISQLGYMFLACGSGAFYAAMFHLTTHAFVKALLFLSAGNVVHMMQGATNMELMGGLWKKFPKTHILFAIGVLAMSGIPPLAIFFSKDLILEQEFTSGYLVLFLVGVLAAVLTAFYLARAYCLTFLGTPRLDAKIFETIKEAPRRMLAPVIILAILSIVGGFLGFAFGKPPLLEHFLLADDPTLDLHDLNRSLQLSPETWLSIAAGLIGLTAGGLMYTRFYKQLGPRIQLLTNAFYLDQVYWFLFAVPLGALSKLVARFLEPIIFDGSIRMVVNTTQRDAVRLQRMQSGQIRSYVAWMLIGTALLLAYLILKGV